MDGKRLTAKRVSTFSVGFMHVGVAMEECRSPSSMPVQRVVVSATEPQGKARLPEQSDAPAANGNRRELPAAMKSRLKRIQDWEALAKEASYDPVTMAALCPIS